MGRRAEERRKKREAKKAGKILNISAAQLEQYRRDMKREWIKQSGVILKEYAEQAAAEYEQCTIEAIHVATSEDVNDLLSYLLALSARVLVEHFGWKPVRFNVRKTRLERFAECLIAEINRIEDNGITLRDYVAETEQLYGVRFKTE